MVERALVVALNRIQIACERPTIKSQQVEKKNEENHMNKNACQKDLKTGGKRRS